ncbi:MAG: hypothetical protein KGN76_16800 [Acidobacteriota bacterium]|nr:hypothetical protein [Acidobacteriota bacterium]
MRASAPRPSRAIRLFRLAWTVVSLLVVQVVVFGLSLMPVAAYWSWLLTHQPAQPALRLLAISASLAPSYIAFALLLMAASALATRLAGWRTAPDQEWAIADLEWGLLDWGRYMVAIHLVRLCAGAVFRGSPLWTTYLRWSGARLGRRVYVNSLSVSDPCLLDFGDDVVIGADVHLSGHTVEAGFVKTGAVRLGAGVTVGLGAVVGIGVEAGTGCQIGALSLVPKHTRLEARAVYAGIPVKRIE